MVSELPHNFEFQGITHQMELGDPIAGSLDMEMSDPSAGHFSLEHALLQGSFLQSTVWVTFGSSMPSYTIGVLKDSAEYFVFDSHSRDIHGMCTAEGNAVILKFSGLEYVVRHIKQLATSIGIPSDMFEVVPATILPLHNAMKQHHHSTNPNILHYLQDQAQKQQIKEKCAKTDDKDIVAMMRKPAPKKKRGALCSFAQYEISDSKGVVGNRNRQPKVKAEESATLKFPMENRKRKAEVTLQTKKNSYKCKLKDACAEKTEAQERRLENMAKDKLRKTAERKNQTENDKVRAAAKDKLRKAADRRWQTSEERQNTAAKDKLRKVAERNKQTQEVRLRAAAKDRLKKEADRRGHTNEERIKAAVKDKLRKATKRIAQTEEDKVKAASKDRLRKVAHRRGHTTDERIKAAAKDNLRKVASRKSETKEDKLRALAKNRLTKAATRRGQTQEERVKASAIDRLRKAADREKQTEEDKLKAAEKDRLRKSADRENQTEEEKLKAAEEDRLRKAAERENQTEEDKLKAAEEDRLRKAAERENQTEEDKLKAAEEDRLRKAAERENQTEEDKLKGAEEDRLRKAAERENQTEEDKLKATEEDRLRKAAERENQTEEDKLKAAEEDRLRKAAERKNQTEDNRARKAMDKFRKATARRDQTEEDRMRTTTKDRLRKAADRKQLTDEDRERATTKDKLRKAAIRADLTEEDRVLLATKDRLRKAADRGDQTEEDRKRAAAKDRLRKSTDRRGCTDNEIIAKFHSHNNEAPIYICTSCHQQLYKETVMYFKRSNYKASDSFLLNCISNLKSADHKEWICKSCNNYLMKKKMPPQCIANKLEVHPVPEQLQVLTTLESRLLAKRYPFMKIVSLPRGRQPGIRGGLVNVPVVAETVCESLPRTPCQAGIIPLKLKRKLSYKNYVSYRNIRPNTIKEALAKLKDINKFYQEVPENDDWEKDCNQENPDIWQTFVGAVKSNDTEQNDPHTALNTLEEDRQDQERLSATEHADEDDSSEEESDPVSQLRGVRFDTCVQPSDPTLNVDGIYSIAPGEGRTPISIMQDPNCEEQSFPQLFPTGEFGYQVERNVKLSPKKYFVSRLLPKMWSTSFLHNTFVNTNRSWIIYQLHSARLVYIQPMVIMWQQACWKTQKKWKP